MKLIYIAYSKVSVFESQVITLLNYFASLSQFDEIIFIIGFKYNEKITRDIEKKLNKKIRVNYYKHFPQYQLIERLTIFSLKKVLNNILDLQHYIIHVRNDVLSHYVYSATRKILIGKHPIIADVRGAGFEQIAEYSNKHSFLVRLKKNQRKQVFKSLEKIRNISVVSQSLRNYLQNSVSNKSLNIKVNSCIASNDFVYNDSYRKEIRSKLNIPEKEILFVLSTGGDNKWQNTNYTINELTKKNYKILNLSRSRNDSPNVINMYVPYKDVPKYLCAVDVAIVWRNDSITNKVASPVKFSEYICCGLPVITNNSIDLITNFIIETKSGKVINSIKEIDEDILNELLKIDRNKLSCFGRNNFGIDSIASQYLKFYNDISKINN